MAISVMQRAIERSGRSRDEFDRVLKGGIDSAMITSMCMGYVAVTDEIKVAIAGPMGMTVSELFDD
jgi:hypothetical protein